MAKITITIPDKELERIKTSFCSSYGYVPMLPNSGEPKANPETQEDFMKKKIIGFIKDAVQEYEVREEGKRIDKKKSNEIENIEIL